MIILGYAECPCPTSQKLEKYFYPTANSILKASCDILNLPISDFDKLPVSDELIQFKGPF